MVQSRLICPGLVFGLMTGNTLDWVDALVENGETCLSMLDGNDLERERERPKHWSKVSSIETSKIEWVRYELVKSWTVSDWFFWLFSLEFVEKIECHPFFCEHRLEQHWATLFTTINAINLNIYANNSAISWFQIKFYMHQPFSECINISNFQ